MARRHWQSHADTQKRELDQLKKVGVCTIILNLVPPRLRTLLPTPPAMSAFAHLSHQENNSFVLVLIDGDGAVFQDHLLKSGAEGGSEAAYKLYNEIRHKLEDRFPSIGQWNIITQVYANFEDLSRKLTHVGILQDPSEIHAFARSFSVSQPLFSFIDVGRGKERADYKIKGMSSPANCPFFPLLLFEQLSIKLNPLLCSSIISCLFRPRTKALPFDNIVASSSY